MDDTFWQLLKVAKRRTEEEKLIWRAIDDETFHATIKQDTLRIGREWRSRSDDEGGEYSVAIYTIWVLDAQSRVVEEAEVGPTQATYTLAEELFRTARKSALASDKVIEGMLSALSSEG